MDTKFYQDVGALPSEGYVRLKQVLKVVPVSTSHWWEGVKSGRFPAPLKISPKVTVWSVYDIRKLLESFEAQKPKAGK